MTDQVTFLLDDRDLLRRFEPVLRFNAGESFFPMEVDRYVRASSLWIQRPGEAAECLIPEGELTLEVLAETRSDQNGGFDAVTFLKFIEPLNIAEMARFQVETALGGKRDPRDVFHAGRGRLARVGYGSRLLDAIFSLTLLARGRVPGDTAQAAQITIRRFMAEDERYQYCGRVIREKDWIALQYWLFYPYNDWRTGFSGVNDHEADWEQVIVFCYVDEDTNEVTPEWTLYSSHYSPGPDVRRRWDDPELEKVDGHPVVYVAAGSHGSYYSPGEYLTEVEIPFLAPFARLADRFNKARLKALERYQGAQIQQTASSSINLFRIPFVDYARGDGWAIGPGQERAWAEPLILSDPAPGWVTNYRGLWGLFANDPLSGEDAPAGAMYERSGAVRKSWYDPVGWAGLDKTPPPSKALDEIYDRRAEISARRTDLRGQIDDLNEQLVRLGVGAEAMRGQPHLKALFERRQAEIAGVSADLDAARVQLTEDNALLLALDDYAEQLQSGARGPLRAHINRALQPIPPSQVRLGRIAEFWAAVSIGLMMITLVLLIAFDREALGVGLAVAAGTFLVIEAAFRRWLSQLVAAVSVILAVVSAVLLLVNFFWPVVIAAILLLGTYLLWDNLRELWT